MDKLAKEQIFFYKNGLPFQNTLDRNLDALRERIEMNKASLMVISGPVGEGKTTLAVHCAEYYQRGKLDFKKQIAFGGEQFQEKLQMCIDDKIGVLIYDEAGDFNSRGSLTSFNQQINRVFETFRTFRIFIILCLPMFSVLDSALFDKAIPRLLLYCHGRGMRYGSYKGYSLSRMYYLKDRMKRITVPPQAFGQVSPNFYGNFLDLEPARSRSLDEISTSEKSEILNENILSNRGLLDYKALSKTLNMSMEWVKLNVRKLKLEHNFIFKKRKYFDPSVIPKLKEAMK